MRKHASEEMHHQLIQATGRGIGRVEVIGNMVKTATVIESEEVEAGKDVDVAEVNQEKEERRKGEVYIFY